MKLVWSFLSNWWCYKTHPTPMWPVLGKYRCPKCLRQYPVPWENGRNRFHLGKAVQPPAGGTVPVASN